MRHESDRTTQRCSTSPTGQTQDLAALVVAQPAGPDEARAVFDRMERTVLACKPLHVRADLPDLGGKDVSARLVVARGNKLRVELGVPAAAGGRRTATTVSDGARLRTPGAGRGRSS